MPKSRGAHPYLIERDQRCRFGRTWCCWPWLCQNANADTIAAGLCGGMAWRVYRRLGAGSGHAFAGVPGRLGWREQSGSRHRWLYRSAWAWQAWIFWRRAKGHGEAYLSSLHPPEANCPLNRYTEMGGDGEPHTTTWKCQRGVRRFQCRWPFRGPRSRSGRGSLVHFKLSRGSWRGTPCNSARSLAIAGLMPVLGTVPKSFVRYRTDRKLSK